MTGECYVCKSRIRDKAVMANLEDREEITKYCSHECRYEDVGKPEKSSKHGNKDDNETLWD